MENLVHIVENFGVMRELADRELKKYDEFGRWKWLLSLGIRKETNGLEHNGNIIGKSGNSYADKKSICRG